MFRKKRALSPSQESTEKKKTRWKDFDNIPDSLSTSTTSPDACFLPAMDSHANKAERKVIKTKPEDNRDDMIDKSMVNKEQSNQIIQASSEDQQNCEVQYLEEIKQLQTKVREQEIVHEGELQPN